MYTMEDFKTKKIAVTFASDAERDAFLQECEKAGIAWRLGQKANEWTPTLPASTCVFVYNMDSDNALSYGILDGRAKKENWQFIPFSAFSFSPRHELHITTDGLTTHAVYKIDGKIIKRSKATCSPADKYDFATGAKLAMSVPLGWTSPRSMTRSSEKRKRAIPCC